MKSFSKKYKTKRGGGFGYWSQDFSIAARCTEDFSAEFNLESMPPTSTCEQIDIKHQLIVSPHVVLWKGTGSVSNIDG